MHPSDHRHGSLPSSPFPRNHPFPCLPLKFRAFLVLAPPTALFFKAPLPPTASVSSPSPPSPSPHPFPRFSSCARDTFRAWGASALARGGAGSLRVLMLFDLRVVRLCNAAEDLTAAQGFTACFAAPASLEFQFAASVSS